jgi:[glutamine synthetase] adenylyltransferase / [glutamine synthetase]-adenylyl-L-tyrosine phosphorylase
MARADAHSPYLRRLMVRFPAVVAGLERGELHDIVPDIDPDLPVGQALRQAKGRLALTVAIGDLAGLLSLGEVTAALSGFADRALNAAIVEAIKTHVPDAEPVGLAALALGKHGSSELNYSSDIDPVFIFDPALLPRRSREDGGEAAVRIGRRVVELMQARDGNGYVFRVDLRLRPSPEVSPIVLPVDTAISHYESAALTWERAAFIRARACAGDTQLGEQFLAAIQPFVWRRSLDFGAIRDIRALSHRIRDHFSSGQAFGPGYDLKRGRGGIRECEFFAQIHQLIHGGRDAGLRCPATRDALASLGIAGRIGNEDAAGLSAAYTLLRTVEHRLQMVDDQQTHSLPTDRDALDGVAKLHGAKNGRELLELLSPHVSRVGTVYDALDAGVEANDLPVAEDALHSSLTSAGFPDPDQAAKRITDWRSGQFRAVRSPAAREALEAVLPEIVETFGAAPDPMRALNQLSTLIERLPSAINLFRLLDAQPNLLRLLMTILSHAPTLAGALARRPDLLDRLIDATAFELPGDVPSLISEMSLTGDLESQLDQVRRIVGEYRFALGVQLVEGARDPLDVAGGYARIAEAALGVITSATIAEFERTHGRVEGSELVIIALGRMGGAELTHASDLDLIYLFTGDFTATSNGQKPLGAVHYFNRLAQRVTAGLSVQTAAGALYDVDTRLRPSGADGPLAVSLAGFARYQAENAWTWEHMALCRARVIFGSSLAKEETTAIIDKTLKTARNVATLSADAIKMRREMRLHKPPGGPFDVKLCSGGLVDLEFAVHVTQLTNNKEFKPHLAAAIAGLVTERLFPKEFVTAHAVLTRALVTLRLMAPDLQEPDAVTCALIARACGLKSWQEWLDTLADARQSVTQIWSALEGETS